VIVDDASPPALLRIGELSRRVGISDHVLRAWERRYGLLRPVRTAGGFRLYSEADLDRIRRMQAHLAQGLSAAEAARAAVVDDQQARAIPARAIPVRATPARAGSARAVPVRPAAADADADAADDDAADADHRGSLAETADALARALDDFDEPAAQAVLDRLLSTLTVETVLRDVVLPLLRRIGEGWAQGTVTVAQEHFASHVIRGRLAGLGRGWGHGHGPRAVLACVPGELHDIALLAFGIVLNRNGWRIDYLGANTPLDDLIGMARAKRPDLVVVSATTPEQFTAVLDGLAQLAALTAVAIAGPGATGAIAESAAVRLLTGDPVTAAEQLPLPGRQRTR
jgi:MerR family transcriptional regulator, light-induced transcriptional regulator